MQYLAGSAAPGLKKAPETHLTGDKVFGRNQRFRRQHRLARHDVIPLLRDGAQLHRATLALKLAKNSIGQGRIAIAVPKRILKKAVERNRVKRAVREVFRLHQVRAHPVDMLVTLQRKTPAQTGSRKVAQREFRTALTLLLEEVSRRFGADGPSPYPHQ